MLAMLALITKLTVSPAVCIAPCSYVRVVAMVEHNVANRWLVFQMDGENFFRSSSDQLDGENAPKEHRLEVKNVPAGNYEILAVLFDSTHEVERKRITLKVTNGEDLIPARKKKHVTGR